jgi:hypothetical protein
MILNNICVIEGNLSTYISCYINKLKDEVVCDGETTNGFNIFSNEAVLYAFLEYAKFPRDITTTERLVYLYEKCCEYDRLNRTNVKMTWYDDDQGYVVTYNSYPVPDNLPF